MELYPSRIAILVMLELIPFFHPVGHWSCLRLNAKLDSCFFKLSLG
jgi:hypothetical protein